jgi:hypothetical protein
MDIYVNDASIDYKPMFPLTWGNLFQKLLQEDDYIPRDHGIVRVILDGADSIQVMVEESENMVPEAIGKLEIYTKDSISITRDGFQRAATLVESIKKEVTAAADLFREGTIKEASGKIVNVMEAIKPMVNFVNSVGMNFSLNFEEILYNPTTNTSLREKIETFLTTLQELVMAQEKRDYVEMADYLEYQLVEDMADWTTIFDVLLKEVEASAANRA